MPMTGMRTVRGDRQPAGGGAGGDQRADDEANQPDEAAGRVGGLLRLAD